MFNIANSQIRGLSQYWMVGWFQVICIHDKRRALVRQDQAAVQQRHPITVATLVTLVVLPIQIIHSVPIRVAIATKVGMLQAPQNLANKALITKSGPPHDHFNRHTDV